MQNIQLFRLYFRSIFIVVEIRLAWSVNAHVSCVHLSHYNLCFFCLTWRHASPVQDYISFTIENFKVSYFVFILQSFERIEAYFLTTWHSDNRYQHSFSIVSVFVSDNWESKLWYLRSLHLAHHLKKSELSSKEILSSILEWDLCTEHQ